MAELTVRISARVHWWVAPYLYLAAAAFAVVEPFAAPGVREGYIGKHVAFVRKHGVEIILNDEGTK